MTLEQLEPATRAAPAKLTVGNFTGADEGEGLDLRGEFLYAVNIGGAAAGWAGGAMFVANDHAAAPIPGFQVRAQGESPEWAEGFSFANSTIDDTMLARFLSQTCHYQVSLIASVTTISCSCALHVG